MAEWNDDIFEIDSNDQCFFHKIFQEFVYLRMILLI